MSGVSLPVTRPAGRAMIIGSAACRSAPLESLQRLGFACAEADDPYSAMAELCRRPLVYRTVVLALASVYREELLVIQAIKRRWPHIDVWLTQTDGRHAALADAMRYGADGLLSEDGLHRIGGTTGTIDKPSQLPARPEAPPVITPPMATPRDELQPNGDGGDDGGNEPILTADELRALLAEGPVPLPDEAES